jgi:hypothetical protein
VPDSRVVFSNRQDKRVRGLRGDIPPNLLTSTLAPTAAPFVSKQTGSAPFRRPYVNADTSQETAKVLFLDETFAPAMSEWPGLPRRRQVVNNTSYRNNTLLGTAVGGNPFVGQSLALRPTRRPIGLDTTQDIPKPLFPDAEIAFKNPPGFRVNPRHLRSETSLGTPKTLTPDAAFPATNPPGFRVNRRLVGTETSFYNAPLLNTPEAIPTVNPPVLLTPVPAKVWDTSQSSPLALLTFDPGSPVFTTWAWPNAIEYRHLLDRSWDSQAFPENIPPAPPPPIPVIEIEIGGTPKKKEAKKEREEFIDEVIADVLKPAGPAPSVPEPLKPILEVRPVIVRPGKAPPPLTVPPLLEIPEDDDATIAALIALGLF